MKSLLLFDIDGTLIDTEGAGLFSLRDGFFRCFPEKADRAFPSLDLGGATDGSVVAFLFEHFEIEDHADHRIRFFRHYEKALEEKLEQFRLEQRGRILPGVPELLARLAERNHDFVLALLTGNTESGARIKLETFGLHEFFPFGAFGSDHCDRNELGPIALRRAVERTGREFPVDKAIVIGDTVKDIRCARACGARVLAVATGGVSRSELEAASPDAVVDDLADTDAAVSLLEALLDLSED